MKTSIKWLGLAVAVIVLGSAAFAQGGGRRSGGPSDVGVIKTISKDGTSITLQSRVANAVTKVELDNNSRLFEYVNADLAQLKVGDFIFASGVPMKLQANALEIGGSVRELLLQPVDVPGGNDTTSLPPMASGRLGGLVTSLQPLTVDFNGLPIEIVTTATTQVIKQQPLADKAALRPGAKIIVVGQQTNTTVTVQTLILDSTSEGIPAQSRGGRASGAAAH
jgi:hypothetical protein